MLIILVPLFIFTLAIVIDIYFTNVKNLLTEKRWATRAVVDLAYSTIKTYADLEESGATTLEEAQQQAQHHIKNLRYGPDGKDYLWINDYHPKMIMHPYKSSLNGKDLSKFKDPNGVFLFNEMVEVVKKDGAGFVDYHWQWKDDATRLEPKISYVRGFKKWNWIVGSGIYVNDIKNKVLSDILTTFLFILLFLIITSFVIFWLVSKKIINPMLILSNNLENISSSVGTTSEQVSISSNKLATSANEQASSIEETSASLEEIDRMVNRNVENAQKATTVVQEVKEFSEKGNISMQDLLSSMTDILDSNDKIQNLVAIIEEISQKTNIINDIVFKTQLLSFNASIEAARAGQYGKGFAVVAEEVGNLAQMSGSAAQEISSIASQSVKNAERIVNENKDKVNKGNDLVKKVAEVLQEIVKSAETVAVSTEEIHTASREQATGIGQINTAIGTLGKNTQNYAAISVEVASESGGLKKQVHSLNSFITNLVLQVSGEETNTKKTDQQTDNNQNLT